MKTKLFFYTCLLALSATAQENERASSVMEQQLENLTHTSNAEPEDDSFLQQLEHFKRHPLHINTATAEELEELNILSGLQVTAFISYRKLFGKLVSQYELQAIPSWDINTIKRLLPFIIVTDDKNLIESLKDRWQGGDEMLMARWGRIIEKSKGYEKPVDTSASHYLGSPDKIFWRYSYNYKNLLQWGLLADKDAGEQFFKGAQKQGFDFYSFHFFARRIGIVKAVAIGDFTVNLGQGLIQWQSLAFKKSAAVLNIKRQSAVLRPYNSAGEYNFHRGAGITLQKKQWEATLFASLKKVSANTIPDTVYNDGAVSSFQTSGYHRTPAEIADRNSLRQWAFGGNVQWNGDNFHAGINSVYYHFSKPVHKPAEPYSLFALHGSLLANAGIDYSYTWRNLHVFGEAATDNSFHTAYVNGALISLDAIADASIVYRKINKGYRSLQGNAFTENSLPVNEEGWYTGLSVKPFTALRIDVYADVFRFAWLKYRVDAPSSGKDFLLQATVTPAKNTELVICFTNEAKMINQSNTATTMAAIDVIPVKALRLQSNVSVNKEVTVRSRTELLWYNNASSITGQGFLSSADVFYKPMRRHWQGNLRFQYFSTGGFNERIYAYEADLPSNFSIPFYYDSGVRYYYNVGWDASRLVNNKKHHNIALNCWLRWAQTIYSGKNTIGSYLDQLNGNHRSEIKCQLILSR